MPPRSWRSSVKPGERRWTSPGDLTTEAACIELTEKTMERFGRIDVLTVVAGEQRAYESILDIPSDHFDPVVKTNVYALFWLVKGLS